MTHIASNILVSILATALIMQHEISGWMDGWVPHLFPIETRQHLHVHEDCRQSTVLQMILDCKWSPDHKWSPLSIICCPFWGSLIVVLCTNFPRPATLVTQPCEPKQTHPGTCHSVNSGEKDGIEVWYSLFTDPLFSLQSSSSTGDIFLSCAFASLADVFEKKEKKTKPLFTS